MADNYLEKKMEDLQNRLAAKKEEAHGCLSPKAGGGAHEGTDYLGLSGKRMICFYEIM